MAERSTPLWALFEQLGAELQRAIVELLSKAGRKQLRLACTSARALLNSCVARIRLPAENVIGRPLRLLERFPRLELLELLHDPTGVLTESAFADLVELPRLASLVKLSLRDSKSLGTAAVVVLQQCCPQLRSLNLAGTGGSSPGQPMGTHVTAAHLTTVTYESTPRAVLTATT
jgi:hypothetical protein